MPTSPPAGPVIPAPRGAAEPTRTTRATDQVLGGPQEAPGWLTVIEALDRAAAGLVARFEHQLAHADPTRARQLRRQLVRARRVEATTSTAAEAARRRAAPATPPVARSAQG